MLGHLGHRSLYDLCPALVVKYRLVSAADDSDTGEPELCKTYKVVLLLRRYSTSLSQVDLQHSRADLKITTVLWSSKRSFFLPTPLTSFMKKYGRHYVSQLIEHVPSSVFHVRDKETCLVPLDRWQTFCWYEYSCASTPRPLCSPQLPWCLPTPH